MEVKNPVKMFFGVLFCMLALISIFGLWHIFSVEVPWQTWPIAMIVVGVLFMCNQKGFALAGIAMMIMLGLFSTGWDCCGDLEKRTFEERFDLEGVEYVDLVLEYGVGDIYLVGEDRDDILFSAFTNDFDDPVTRMQMEGAEKRIDVSRGSSGIGRDDRWSFYLGRDVVYDLVLEYGVADVVLDLRDLDVERLNILQGVSDTRIVFGDYPSVVKMEAGVSDIDFEFREGSGVVIEVEGGLLDKDFEGFVRKGGKWYSEGFEEDGENIVIEFEGGVGDLGSKFY